jgi:hypothetical protein
MCSKGTMVTCNICCEDYNKTNRKQTNCRFCDFTCCLSCQKRYILSVFDDPHCMNCKKGFLRDHLVEIFPKVFLVGEYKIFREQILYEREKCMLPGTQAEIEIEDEKKKINDQIKALNRQIWDISAKTAGLRYERHTKTEYGETLYLRKIMTPEEQKEFEECQNELKKLYVNISQLRRDRNRLQWAHLGGEKNNEERRQFVKKCPGDNCNGFLSTQWKCGLCGLKVCNKCHEKKSDEEDSHVCNEEAVKSVELINKDTKPCPACGIRIFKLVGCSQMWCTSCHVAFDWNTLKIATGVIHNPHFYEYQRQQNGGIAPRVAGDNPCCEQIPHIYRCQQIWQAHSSGTTPKILRRLSDMHRLLTHIQNYEVPRLPHQFQAHANKDVRIMFLKNNIDEKRFMWYLQKREKKESKGRELRQLYEMFVACGSDFVRRSINNDNVDFKDKKKMYENILTEFRNLCQYLNDHAKKISSVYGGVVPQVSIIEDNIGGNWCVLQSFNPK